MSASSALRRAIPVLLPLVFAGCISACASSEAVEAYEQGSSALARGDFSGALTHFDRAITLDPGLAEAYLGRGMIRWQFNQHERALPDLDRSIELDSTLTWAYYLRGASLVSLHRHEASLADFDRVTTSGELPPEDLVRAHRWRAIALLNLVRYEDAADAFTQCIELQPGEPFHRVERGRVYQALGQVERAKADYQKYLALSDEENELTEEVQQRLAALEQAGSE